MLKYIDFPDGEITLHTGHIKMTAFRRANFALCLDINVGFSFYIKENKFIENSGRRKFYYHRVTYFTNFHEEVIDSYEDLVIMTKFYQEILRNLKHWITDSRQITCSPKLHRHILITGFSYIINKHILIIVRVKKTDTQKDLLDAALLMFNYL